MNIRKSLLIVTLATLGMYATAASAFPYNIDRDPPKGLNGASVDGVVNKHVAGVIKQDHGQATKLKSVVLPDGARAVVK